MNWRWLFFSFRGRINRARYWRAMLVYLLIGIAVWIVGWALNSLVAVPTGYAPNVVYRTMHALYGLALWISCLAVAVKRLHDRDKSGWWLLALYATPVAAFLLVRFVGAVNSDLGGFTLRLSILAALAFVAWISVELGFLPGTHGYNRFGRDPLATA